MFEKAVEEDIKGRPLNEHEALLYEALGSAEKVSGVAKSLLTGGDLSGALRQNLILTAHQAFRNPRQLGRALKEMVLSYSEKRHAQYEKELQGHKDYQNALDAGLNLNVALADHDAFKAADWMANVINRGRKLPGWDPRRWVAKVGEKYALGAARSYTHYQNRVMLDTWSKGIDILRESREGHFVATKKSGENVTRPAGCGCCAAWFVDPGS